MSTTQTTQAEALQQEFNRVTKKRTLFEIVEAMRAELDRIDEAQGEVDDAAGAALDELTGGLEQKVEAYAAVYRALKEEAEACKRFQRHYTDRAKRKESQAEALRHRLQTALELLGLQKVEAPTATAALQQSPASLELLVPEHEAEKHIPEEYLERPVVIRKDEIKKALQSGAELPFAHLVRGTHLRFR